MEVSNGSPLDIPEILQHVMKYVGSNPIDLLTCRLVNSAWNKLVTGMLKKKGICVAIGHYNIKAYRALVEKCQLERTSLNPTDQVGNDGASCDRLNINVRLPCCSADPLPMITQLKNMLNKSQEKCEVESVIDPNHQIDNENDAFYQLLQLTSSTLKNLYLIPRMCSPSEMEWEERQDRRQRRLQQQNGIEEVMEVDEEVGLLIPTSFPKLQSIVYDVHTFSQLEPTPKRIIKIIEAAPSLQSLIIPVMDEDLNLGLDYQLLQTRQQKVVTRIVDWLLRPNNKLPLGLTNLELPICNEKSLIGLCQLRLPKLQTLKLHQKIVCMLSKSFCGFLANNVPALDTLELYFLHPTTKPPIDLNDFNPSFGQIPQITNIGIYTRLPEDFDNFDFYEESDFDKSSLVTSVVILAYHCPNLISMGTEISALEYLAFALMGKESKPVAENLPTHLKPFYSSIIFPNVTQLSVNLDSAHNFHLHYWYNEYEEEDAELMTTQLESMYPSLTRLVLNHEDETRPTNLDKWILNSGLQSMLKINGIQSLEVNNYFDWLPHLLGKWLSDDTLRNLRQNLKHLKFGDSRPNFKIEGTSDTTTGGGISRRRRSDRRIIANIDYDEFLKLKTVQIQEKILRRDSSGKITGFGDALKFLNSLRSRPLYPAKQFDLYY